MAAAAAESSEVRNLWAFGPSRHKLKTETQFKMCVKPNAKASRRVMSAAALKSEVPRL
jgi:hypothetical protein